MLLGNYSTLIHGLECYVHWSVFFSFTCVYFMVITQHSYTHHFQQGIFPWIKYILLMITAFFLRVPITENYSIKRSVLEISDHRTKSISPPSHSRLNAIRHPLLERHFSCLWVENMKKTNTSDTNLRINVLVCTCTLLQYFVNRISLFLTAEGLPWRNSMVDYHKLISKPQP